MYFASWTLYLCLDVIETSVIFFISRPQLLSSDICVVRHAVALTMTYLDVRDRNPTGQLTLVLTRSQVFTHQE